MDQKIRSSKGKECQVSPPNAAQTSEGMSGKHGLPNNNASRQLRCLIQGEFTVFRVTAVGGDEISELKLLIHERGKKGRLANIDAKELILLKVNIYLPSQSKDSLQQLAINTNEGVQELIDWRPVSYFWPAQPPDDFLHVFVRLPGTESTDMILDDLPLHRSRTAPPNEVDQLIEGFMTKCRPRMKELIACADDVEQILPSWQPVESMDHHWREHVSGLHIPWILETARPSLLLHNLGEEKNKLDHNRATRIPNIFCGEHRILTNTSGSGKTRLLLEGLCRHWGFYFTAQRDSSATGSHDFGMILTGFNEHQDYKRAKMMNEGNKRTPESVEHVRETVRRGLYQLLLARFLMLHLLFQEIQAVTNRLSWAQYRRLWVLLQAQPDQVFGPDVVFKLDVFADLALLLRCAGRHDLEQRIYAVYGDLHSFKLLRKGRLFCVLDEAQVTTDINHQDFFSDVDASPRPALREIWLTWTSVLSTYKMCLIISGTGIELDEITQTLASPAAKEANYGLIHEIGAFDDQDDQAMYIQQYIPADWSDDLWKDFLNRAWAWFRGRYRFTATLVSLILRVGSLSPHGTINSYVEAFTGFKPTDGDNLTKQEPVIPVFPKITALNLNKMSEMQGRTLCEVMFQQILYGSYSLRSFTAVNRAKFIEYGFARHKPGVSNPVFDEPLAIMAALTWLNKNAQFSLIECLRHDIGKHAKRGNGFEAFFAFYVRKVFETPKKLDEIFTFRSDFVKRDDVAWQREDFELVTVVDADGGQPMVSVVRPYHGPSSNLGIRATSGEEVLLWISKNHEQFAFCFPPESFGPNVLFFVQSVVSKKLLLVATQCKHYREVRRGDLIVGVRTVTPSWFWKSKDHKFRSVEDATFVQNGPRNIAQLAAQTKEALGNIPLGLAISGADFPVLRVFASWEGDARLERSLCPNTKPSQSMSKTQAGNKGQIKAPVKKTKVYDIDLHPVAALHLGNFDYVNKQMDVHWFQGDVEQREVVHLKRSVHSSNPHGVKRKRDVQMEGLDVN